LNILKTKYGDLKNPIIGGKYPNGEIEELRFEEKNVLNINGKEFIPVHDILNSRKKDFSSVKFFEDGNIRALSLQDATNITTDNGEFEVEKIIFYEDGKYNRLFFLNGRLSGFWSEEDEYELAKEYSFKLNFAEIKAKFISMRLYKSQKLKSLTLWPKEIIEVPYKNIKIKTRIGVSLFEDGSPESCEPNLPIKIETPIGIIEAYDKNAVGVHGEDNSLKFYKDGSIKSLITSTNVIKVYDDIGLISLHTPQEERLFVNDDILDIITVDIEFKGDTVIIDGEYEYSVSDNKFKIEYYGEKRLTLSGDI